MPYDVQVISLVDEYQIISTAEIEGAEPRAIRIVGRGGFNDAQRVIINDYGVDSFSIITDTILIVYPPSLFDNLTVGQMKFSVVSGSYSGGKSARLVFGPTKNVKRVSGLQSLVQKVVKTFLSNSNSNKFNLGEGGDLLRSLGGSMSIESKSRITALVAQAVDQTEAQVLSSQANVRGLAASERLLSFKLVEVNFLPDRLEVVAKVRLVTYAGKSVDIPLTL